MQDAWKSDATGGSASGPQVQPREYPSGEVPDRDPPGPEARCTKCGSLLCRDGLIDECTMLRTKRHLSFEHWLEALVQTVSIRLDATAGMILETHYRGVMWGWWEALWTTGQAAERAGEWLDLEQTPR